jgi:hypothetical protein
MSPGAFGEKTTLATTLFSIATASAGTVASIWLISQFIISRLSPTSERSGARKSSSGKSEKKK